MAQANRNERSYTPIMQRLFREAGCVRLFYQSSCSSLINTDQQDTGVLGRSDKYYVTLLQQIIPQIVLLTL